MRTYPAMKCEACGHENIDGARFCAKCGALVAVHEADAEDPLIGQLIGGRYRISSVLGEGGMGKVYVGEQQMGSTVRKVAVKTLHQHLSKDPAVLARFHRECGTVAQLEHPNTIKFFDFGATPDGTLYIAMEFVKGKSLMDAIEQGGPMASARALKIMKQVCGALDEAHKLGIIHRDLKPENIVLTDRAGETDFVKVLDFGIAARSESADAQKEAKLTQQGMVLGTPPYMSPEQFTGKQLDLRSDIYSLGVLTYEMLTGKLPFEADTPWQWATQHMTAQPTPFELAAPSSIVPDGMRTAILRALSKDRDQRQETCGHYFKELSGGGGLTVEAQAMGPVSAPRGNAPTAAMPAAPAFVAPAPAAQPPAAYGPPVGAQIPAPQPRGDGGAGGGGKGLIFGLVGALGLLALAIVIVVVRSRKKDEDVPLTNPFTSSTVPATTVAPTGTPTDTVAVPPSGTEPDKPAPTAHTTGTSTSPHPTASASSTAKGPSGAAACAACLSAARGGNISGAAASYNKCDDAGQKGACSAAARAAAPGAVRSAAMNGNCSQAKGIAGAARAMGADSPAIAGSLGKCK